MTAADPERERRLKIRALVRQLGEEREASVAQAQTELKEQRAMRKRVKDRLRAGPATVPELAEATGLPSATVLQQIAAMRKYGSVVEAEQDGNYFRYRLVEEAP
jgi:DNA-binding transcriptional ArsR family regulator